MKRPEHKKRMQKKNPSPQQMNNQMVTPSQTFLLNKVNTIWLST